MVLYMHDLQVGHHFYDWNTLSNMQVLSPCMKVILTLLNFFLDCECSFEHCVQFWPLQFILLFFVDLNTVFVNL